MFLYMSEEKHVTFHKHYVFKWKIILFFPFKSIMLVNIAVHIAMNKNIENVILRIHNYKCI